MQPRPWKNLFATAAACIGVCALLGSSASAEPKKPAGGDEGEIEMEGDGEAQAGEGEIEMEGEPEGDLAADTAASDAAAAKKAPTILAASKPVSWQDIVTVIRKPFLKLKRFELLPLVGTTLNDNMVRHYSMGGEINYYLTDVLAVGVEGQYFVKQFREPFDLVARQARHLPTVNKYNFSAALNFHYVPVYGKFAVFNRHLITWEAYFTAGVGIAQSEVIPRDTRFPGFTSFLISPNVGASMRFFLNKWLTVNIGVRDYIFIDKFEPTNRSAIMNATADLAKSNADSSLINNVMFQMGISIWFPMSFEYTTFR
jgi:outer membrane beta-barrel protein